MMNVRHKKRCTGALLGALLVYLGETRPGQALISLAPAAHVAAASRGASEARSRFSKAASSQVTFCLTVIVAGANLLAGSSRRARREPAADRAQSQSDVPMSTHQATGEDRSDLPTNLYELLGIDPDADRGAIRQKYHELQKLCHPDVAGNDGQEMCVLLNDAWETLSDEKAREEYNSKARPTQPSAIQVHEWKQAPLSTDTGPTWKGPRKTLKHHTEYTGIPLSASFYNKVAPEDRGARWETEQMLFVDEWACICCRNCCDIAPSSFCIQSDNGRANVYTQWGNSEEYLDYAVAACPVDCIYWVDRTELQVLEWVTAQRMVEDMGNLPCPMQARQKSYDGALPDPFGMAGKYQGKLEQKLRMKAQASEEGKAEYDAFQLRMQKAFKKLPQRLRASMFPRR